MMAYSEWADVLVFRQNGVRIGWHLVVITRTRTAFESRARLFAFITEQAMHPRVVKGYISNVQHRCCCGAEIKALIADCMTPGLERRPKHPVRLACLLPDLAVVIQQLASVRKS